jgi:hypothetical protein
MTKITETDPILLPTEANQSKGEKRRAGRLVLWALVGIGLFAFAVYLAMIVVAFI